MRAARPSPSVRLARGTYAALLWLYPPAFRRALAADMRHTFNVRLDRLRQESRRQIVRFCWSNYVDALESAAAEWVDRTGYPSSVAGAVRPTTTRALHATASVVLFAAAIGTATAVMPAASLALGGPPGFAEPDRLVRLGEVSPAVQTDYVSPLTFDDWVARNPAFDGLAAYRHWESVPFEGGAVARTVTHVGATANFFDVLGVAPALGRTFVHEQKTVGSEAVISDALWREYFDGAPAIVGRTVYLRGEPTRIVGVMPPVTPGLELGWGDVWTCLYRYDVAQQRATGYRDRYLRVVGRLRDGVSMDEARTRMRSLQTRLWSTPGAVAAGFDIRVATLARLDDTARATMMALAGGAWAFLALAGAWAVSRAASRPLLTLSSRPRQRGARWRLIGLAAATSTASCLVVGALMRHVGGDTLVSSLPGAPVIVPVVAAGMAGGLLPFLPHHLAARARRQRCHRPSLDQPCGHPSGHRSAHASFHGSWVHRGLAILQVSLAVVVLTCTGLLWRSLVNLERVDLGFEPNRTWSVDFFLPGSRDPGPQNDQRYVRGFLQRLSEVRGVADVGGLLYFPQRPKVWPTSVWTRTADGQTRERPAHLNLIAGDALRAMGTPLVAGRLPTAFETFERAPVAVINQALAALLFPERDALGALVRADTEGSWFSVVGIVRDTRQLGRERPGDPEVFLPYWSMPMPFMTVVVRTAADAADVPARLQQAVRDYDPDAVGHASTVTARLEYRIADRRFVACFLLLVAAISVGIAALALRDTVRRGGRDTTAGDAGTGRARPVVVPGVALGVLVTLACVRVMQPLLFAVSPHDPPRTAWPAPALRS